jgi:hypothetical protein
MQMKLQHYKKAIVALVGVLVLLSHRHWGYDLTGQEAALVDIVIGALTAAGVFQVKNEEF